MEAIQPAENIGDTVADLPSDPDAGGAAAVGSQVVDGLHVHAEILGEFACEYGLETEPEESLSIHNP